MENFCKENLKPSSKKWVIASVYPKFRRNLCLRSTNAGLFHYAGNNPVRYIDPNGREDFLFITPKDFISLIFERDPGAKAVKVYSDAASGDESAQVLAKALTVDAGKEMARYIGNSSKSITLVTLRGLETTSDIISEVSGDIALLGFVFKRPEVVFLFGGISEGFSLVSFGISGARATITGDGKDMDNFKRKGGYIVASKAFESLFSRYIKDGFCGGITKFDADAITAFMNKCIEVIGNYDEDE